MKRILLLALVACSANAAIYKCEVDGVTTYSQTPCADDAETVTVNVTGRSAAVSKEDVVQQCFNYIKRTKSWKDPESLRLDGYYTKWESDKSGARNVMMITVYAKNSFGAYDGANYERCFLNHSGDGLSKIQHYINN